jgi:hypothetical protein
MTSFTSPKTYTAGVAHTAAEGNTYIRDNMKNLDERLTLIGQTSDTVLGQLKSAAYGCVLIRTANLNILDSTDTSITFPTASVTEELDSDNFHSGVTNTARITIPSGGGGWYIIGANARWQSSATGQRVLWIELNGTAGAGTDIAESRITPSTTATQITQVVSSVYLLSAGDYISLSARQTSGGALDLQATSYSVRFWALRLFSV